MMFGIGFLIIISFVPTFLNGLIDFSVGLSVGGLTLMIIKIICHDLPPSARGQVR